MRRVAPVHVELAIAPAHVRDAATGIARAGAERPVHDVQMFASGFLEVDELVREAFREGFAIHVLRHKVIRGVVLPLLVRLHPVPYPDNVGLLVVRTEVMALRSVYQE